MTEITLQDYQKWAEHIQSELWQNSAWIGQYKQYAEKMIEHAKDYKEMRKTFRKWGNLDYYLTIGNVKEFEKFFDIRYLGQSVGKLTIENNKPLLNVGEQLNTNSKQYFGYDCGEIVSTPWRGKKGEAEKFRAFYKTHAVGVPRQKEHMVESALFAELEKISSKDKQLLRIQPFSFANTRIHMKTALKASDAKKGVATESKTGGEIDIFCRRKVGKESQLTVIEVKDENKASESFDITMKQAVAYAVFIRELWHSDAGEAWRIIWGLSEGQKNLADKNGLTINAVVAMPKGKTDPSYCGECITLKNDGSSIEDKIALHYIAIESDINEHNANDVKFRTSLEMKKK